MSKLLVIASLLISAFSTTAAFAEGGESESQFCEQIREIAADNCQHAPESQYYSCYRSEVDRLLAEYSPREEDYSAGDGLNCGY